MDQIVNLKLSQLFWFNEQNAARGTGLYRDSNDEHSLISLLVDGWDGQLGRPAVRLIEKTEQAEAVKRLTTQWARLKNADLSEEPEKVKVNGETASVSIPELLKVFESTYVGADGKIIVPQYAAVTCFRRGNSLLKVNTIRAKHRMGVITELPCVVREYANLMDQLTDNIRENQLKTAGARKMSSADEVNAADKLFQLGASEAKLAKAFGLKRGTAQKLHRLCMLNKAHPDLGIVERIVTGDVQASIFDKEKVKGLLDKNASDDEVEAFIAMPNGGNAPKIMARKDIEALATQFPVSLVVLGLQAVLKNDPSMLQIVAAKAKAINEAVEKVLG